MKADRNGPPAEQTRHRLGWQPWRQRQQDPAQDLGLRCSGCRHVAQPGVDRYRCELGSFSTTPTAICREFSARPQTTKPFSP